MGSEPVPDEAPRSHVEAMITEIRNGFRDFDRMLRGYNGDAGVLEKIRNHGGELAEFRAELAEFRAALDALRAHPTETHLWLSEEVREKTKAAKWRTRGEIAGVVGIALSLILGVINLLGVLQ
jgi:hypothetical protein